MDPQQAEQMLASLTAIEVYTLSSYQTLFNIQLNQNWITEQIWYWNSIARWVVAAALGTGMTAGCLLWMQILRGKSQKNMW